MGEGGSVRSGNIYICLCNDFLLKIEKNRTKKKRRIKMNGENRKSPQLTTPPETIAKFIDEAFEKKAAK